MASRNQNPKHNILPGTRLLQSLFNMIRVINYQSNHHCQKWVCQHEPQEHPLGWTCQTPQERLQLQQQYPEKHGQCLPCLVLLLLVDLPPNQYTLSHQYQDQTMSSEPPLTTVSLEVGSISSNTMGSISGLLFNNQNGYFHFRTCIFLGVRTIGMFSQQVNILQVTCNQNNF